MDGKQIEHRPDIENRLSLVVRIRTEYIAICSTDLIVEIISGIVHISQHACFVQWTYKYNVKICIYWNPSSNLMRYRLKSLNDIPIGPGYPSVSQSNSPLQCAHLPLQNAWQFEFVRGVLEVSIYRMMFTTNGCKSTVGIISLFEWHELWVGPHEVNVSFKNKCNEQR